MQFLNPSREDHFSALEKYYSMEDTKLDLMFTNTELGERVYVDYSSVNRNTPPELLYLYQIVQALMIVPELEFWYMLEHAVLSPRGELYLQYSVHYSLSNPCHSLPVYADCHPPSWAYRRFVFPIDIMNIESLKHWAKILGSIATNGSLLPLQACLEPAEQHTMVAVHATGQENANYLHPAHTMNLSVECVRRGMWSLAKVQSDGGDIEDKVHYEVTNADWHYCPGYGLVSQVETDEETKQTYFREIIRWVAVDDSDDEADK